MLQSGFKATGLRVEQGARSTGVVCFSIHVAPLGLWGVVILTCYKHVAPLGLVKHNTYRTNRTQIPVTYELTSLAFCASGKMPDLRVVLVMAYGARAISYVVLLGLVKHNTYRTNRTQIPVTYESTSLAFCASGKMLDLRVVLVMAYGARAISHVVLLGLTRNNG